MSRSLIIVHVSATGETQVSAQGFRGQDCLKATQEIEKSLGLPSARQFTSEFYQTAEHTSSVDLKSGSTTQ